jgi:hypothetical protein
MSDFWSKTYVLARVGSVDVAMLKLYLDRVNDVQKVTDAFSLSIVFQVLSVDLVSGGKGTVNPVAVGPVTVNLISNLGDLKGSVTAWSALDNKQQPVVNGTFQNSSYVSLTLVGQGSIDIPINAIPLPPLAKAILAGIAALLGPTITISLGTIHEIIPLH